MDLVIKDILRNLLPLLFITPLAAFLLFDISMIIQKKWKGASRLKKWGYSCYFFFIGAVFLQYILHFAMRG